MRWSGPTAGTSAFLTQLTVGAATSPKAMELFKEVVLRVWRASNAPDAMVDKMHPIETIEAIYKRVHHMKKTVSDGTITAAASGQGLAPGTQGLVMAPRPGAPTPSGPLQAPGGTTGIAGPTNLNLANPNAARPGVSSVSLSLTNMAARYAKNQLQDITPVTQRVIHDPVHYLAFSLTHHQPALTITAHSSIACVFHSVNSLRTSKEMQAKLTSDALATSKVTPPQPTAHPLGAQMHTPFNARELMWNGYQNMT